jgi:ectoine hydroxylase-related dioxygenase (phytanoyl-CoA dioxygenase family)
MTIVESLHELGVCEGTLTKFEKEFLDTKGYLPLADILSKEQVASMNAFLDHLVITEGADAGKEVHQEPGTNRLSNIIDKSPLFDVCFTHPRVLAGVARVLQNDLHLSSLNYRAALPGAGLQGLHADWSGAVTPGNFSVCNSIWLLDDFTQQNGPTRVVPGSHNSGKTPGEVMENVTQTHPDEIQIIAPAGTVVVFNSHTWHGGTLNTTDKPRRALHSYFARRSHPQQLDQKQHLRSETLARMSEAMRVVLGL